jgi:phosphate transport system substrate-binding protein
MFRGFGKKHRQGYTDYEFWRKCIEGFPQERLNQLLAKEGAELCDDPQRCEECLKAEFPEHSSQVSLLINAMKIGVSKELLAAQNQQIPYLAVRSRLIQRLATNLFLESYPSEWAVDTWWAALSPNLAKPQLEVPPDPGVDVINFQNAIDFLDATEPAAEEMVPDPSTTTQWDIDVSELSAANLHRMLADHQQKVVAEYKSQSQRMVGEPVDFEHPEPVSPVVAPPKATNKWRVPLVALGLGLLAFVIVWHLWPKQASSPTGNPPAMNDGGNSNGGGSNFAAVVNVPKLTVNYGGSTTWAQIRKVVDPQVQQAFPDFQLRYVKPVGDRTGSGTGIRMLLEGQLTLAQSSRPLKAQELQQAAARGIKLQAVPVAIDAIVVVTHPALNVPGLTVEQLKQIYTGEITNWQQVGGPDLAITALSRSPGTGGTVDFFVERVLGAGGVLGSNVTTIADTTTGLRQTAATPGAIYYGSAPEVVDQCTVRPLPLGKVSGQWIPPYQEPFVPLTACPGQRNRINQAAIREGSYPLTRQLFVIFTQNGQSEEQAGQAYANLLLTAQGQKLLNQAGFVSLK